VLLFTNDGELTKKLTHPSFGAKKIYHVELSKPLTKNDMTLLLEGVELEDGLACVDDVQYDEQAKDKRVVGVEIHGGKNRIVRRLFEALDYEVLKLDRVVFAGMTKKDLPRGHWRHLSDKEVGFLKMV
jgi:23S rRNA pseudouridine2605 synthase